MSTLYLRLLLLELFDAGHERLDLHRGGGGLTTLLNLEIIMHRGEYIVQLILRSLPSLP